MQPFAQFTGQARNAFVADVSGQDFSAQLGPVTANGNLTIRFFYEQIRIDDPLDPGANGTYRTVLCVSKRPHGDRLTEAVRIITERTARELYPREFAHFKQNQDVPTDGTPLHELPGISQSQIAILVVHNIRCIEDLTGLHEDQVGQIGMDARSAYALAKRWTETKTANGEMIRDAAKDAQTNAELQRLRDGEARSAAMIAQMQAQIDVMAKMGAAQAQGAGQGAQTAVMVDADNRADMAPSLMLSDPQIVTSNDDLNEDTPAPAALPGLNRKRG